MTKPVGIFINLSEEWELDYFLKKYKCRTTAKNRRLVITLVQEDIKPHFGLTSRDNLAWEDIHTYMNNHPSALNYFEK